MGDRLGDYELLELLGRGGMGEVWRVRDTRRGRVVALKRLHAEYSDRPDFEFRFRREARVTAALSCPHVVPIHDFGEIDGRPFLDMLLVTGGTLADALADAPDGIGEDRALTVVEQVAEALDAAHAAGLVHRDVKPANVLLDEASQGIFCYLTDFGIAKVADDTAAGRVTETGQVLGTSSYTAPELYLTGEATAATDVYALGCVLHEMLCGRRAFAATTALSAMHAHVFGPVPAPSSVRPDLARYDPVIARALAKDPAERYASASELARAARDARAATAAPEPPPASPARRRGPLVAAAALVLVVAVVTAVVLVRPTGGTGDGPAAAAGPPVSGVTNLRPLPVSFRNASAVIVAADGGRAYVSDLQRRGVVVVDLATGREADFLPARFGAFAMALSPDGRTLAVANQGFDDGTGYGVTLVDLPTRVSTSLDRSVEPGRVLFTPDSRTVYVGDHGTTQEPGTTVSALDVATGEVVRTIPVDARPDGMVLSPDRTTLYVASSGGIDGPTSGTIAVIPLDGGPVTGIPTPRSPSAMVGLPDGTLRVVVQNDDPARAGVDVIDPRSRTARIRTEASLRAPYELAGTPDGRVLAVAQDRRSPPASSALSLVDAVSGATRSTVPTPPGSGGVAITPDGRRVLLLSDTTLTVGDLTI
ncbi:serine/threonine-protein kinase [Actinomycetospora termitidis]|uniref:non-specific serine/threonine protein kinase n=1 Tax=Actinomycetospora termitidis TaxID=3053470 RepID=A0ABT7MFX3_9PSEU|nr:serine/threonine-protein kinase [Actinomycetospora sp. Odt1-22]MDL5158263.1 serine/threonine-protein kinase [Actinomycetospora sp. Odt1-22]